MVVSYKKSPNRFRLRPFFLFSFLLCSNTQRQRIHLAFGQTFCINLLIVQTSFYKQSDILIGRIYCYNDNLPFLVDHKTHLRYHVLVRCKIILF